MGHAVSDLSQADIMPVMVVKDIREMRFLHHVDDRGGVAIHCLKFFSCHLREFLLGLRIEVAQAFFKPEVSRGIQISQKTTNLQVTLTRS